MQNEQFFSNIMTRTIYCQWNDDDDVCFVLDQHTELDIYSASSQKQQSTGRYVAPLGHNILILSQPVFALILFVLCMLRGEVTNSNFIVFGLTWPGLEPTIYSIWGEYANH
jgi:hypothetical protein